MVRKKVISSIDQKVAMQTFTFIIAATVIVLSLILFINIYSNKQEQIIKDMSAEAMRLETVISDQLSYSKYFVDTIGRHIQQNPYDLAYIKQILYNHFRSQDFNRLFGWRKYSWVNEQHFEVVNSDVGVMVKPNYLSYIHAVVTPLNNDWRNKIVFYDQDQQGGDFSNLKIIDSVFDRHTHQYLGSVILSYDNQSVARNLNKRKRKASTNFLLLNQNLHQILQSSAFIEHLLTENGELTPRLSKAVQKLIDESESTVTYLDMLSGVNYFITALKDTPFILVVNVDYQIIRQEIIEDLLANLIIIGIFALLALSGTLFIYRRETFLRAKAERATLIAENTTKAKSNFLAFTAHEIRSPLGFILTGSEMLTKELFGVLSDEYKKYAAGIHKNAQVILSFITDILDENQIIEGKFKIINTVNEIEQIIAEAVQVTLSRYDHLTIDIKYQFEQNLPSLICDKLRLQQVISNLITNSIKYSKGKIYINIEVRIIEEELEIKITDQGVGMDEDKIPVALSAYGTLHEQDYCSLGSYGLGLAIVKLLLEAHDAQLQINSVKGLGTTVKISFPKYKLVYGRKISN